MSISRANGLIVVYVLQSDTNFIKFISECYKFRSQIITRLYNMHNISMHTYVLIFQIIHFIV